MAGGGWRVIAYAALLALLGAGPATAGDSDRASAWTGVSAGPSSLYAYAGGTYALNGDMAANGFLARAEMGSGIYDHDGRSYEVPQYDVALLAGYRRGIGWNSLAVFIGPVYSVHDNDDEDADLRGSEWGVKIELEGYTPVTDAIYVSAFANYATAFDTYHANIRAAYRITEDIAAGPAVSVLGSERYDQIRFGAAAAIDVLDYAELGITAGYGFAEEDTDTGFYAGLNVWKSF